MRPAKGSIEIADGNCILQTRLDKLSRSLKSSRTLNPTMGNGIKGSDRRLFFGIFYVKLKLFFSLKFLENCEGIEGGDFPRNTDMLKSIFFERNVLTMQEKLLEFLAVLKKIGGCYWHEIRNLKI